jgi:FkbM family methyltransferase
VPGSYRVRFFPSALSSYAWIYPEVVNEEEAFVARSLAPGDTYVDIGANVGLLALRAAAIVGATGRVFAVEAHPRTAGFLRQNVGLNGFTNVVVKSCAIGDETGTVCFSDRRSDEQNAVDPAGNGLAVPLVPLDTLFPESVVSRVHLLKVDVEGFELHAFRGATALLRRTDRVLFETSPRHSVRYGYPPNMVYELLGQAGFRLRLLSDGSEILPDYMPAGTENVVAERLT